MAKIEPLDRFYCTDRNAQFQDEVLPFSALSVKSREENQSTDAPSEACRQVGKQCSHVLERHRAACSKSHSNILEDLRTQLSRRTDRPYHSLISPCSYHGQRVAISTAVDTKLFLECWRFITQAILRGRGGSMQSPKVIMIQGYSVVFTSTYPTLLKHADVTSSPSV
jgi:hypothetical protein